MRSCRPATSHATRVDRAPRGVSASTSGDPDTPAAPDNAPPSSATLARGLVWVGGARWLAQAFAWVVTLYMARVLTEREYGQAGLVTTVNTWVFALSEFCIGTAMLALRRAAQRDAESLHSMVALSTAVATITIAMLAYPLAAYLRDPQLAPLLMVGGLAVWMQGMSVVPMALLQIRLDFRTIAQAEFLRSATNTLGVALLAATGARVWALPVAATLGASVQCAYVLRKHPLPFVRVTRDRVREVVAYAKDLVLARMAWNTYMNADVMMVGRALNSTQVGLYQFAWNIATLPGEKLVNILQAAMAPFLSALGDDRPSLRKYFLLLTECLALAIWPVLIGLIVVAPDAIPLVFDEKWRPSVLPLQVLVMFTTLQAIGIVVLHALAAMRMARRVNAVSILAALILPPSFFVAAKVGGLPAVAGVWMLATPLMQWRPLQIVLSELKISFREYLHALLAPAVCAALMAVAVLLVQRATVPTGAVMRLLTEIAVGAVAYPLACVVLFPSRITLVQRALRSFRGR
jgi:teichuronic acid exporter